MNSRKVTNYLLGTIIALVVILVAVKGFVNYKISSEDWTEEDREELVNDCIEATEHFAVRFPQLTQEYCGCTADSIMYHFKKAEYDMINSKSMEEQKEYLLPVIAACYNRYQTAIFKATELGD